MCQKGLFYFILSSIDLSGVLIPSRMLKVAVKVLRSVQPGKPIVRVRLSLFFMQFMYRFQTFLRESGLWSAAQHPNITPFLGVSFDFHRRGTPCLVSPFLKEGNIINYIKKHPGANKLALVRRVKSL